MTSRIPVAMAVPPMGAAGGNVVKVIRGGGRKASADLTAAPPTANAPAGLNGPGGGLNGLGNGPGGESGGMGGPPPLSPLQSALLRAVRREDEVAAHRAAPPPDSATGSTLVDDAHASLGDLLDGTDWAAPAVRAALSDANHVGGLLLLWAAMRGHSQLVNILLQCGVSPDACVPWVAGNDPAAAANPADAARLADLVEEAESRQRPLILAAQHGKLQAMRALLLAGAEVDAADALGWTPLLRAAADGHPDAVALLLSHRASPHLCNSDGMSPLHGAIHGGHLACAQMLLAAGASYSIKDNYGTTPTLLARAEDSLPLVSLLWHAALSRNDPSVLAEVDPATQRTPLHDLARLKAPLEMFAPLFPANPTQPSPVTVPDSTGTSPLVYAALSGSAELLALLLTKGLPLFPHPTIDRALPSTVHLLSQLSHPSPLPDVPAKLRELARADAAARASELRFPNPGAVKRAVDLRSGAVEALLSLLSACGIVRESRALVLAELEAVLRGMEAEVRRVRAAREGMKEAAGGGAQAKLAEAWDGLGKGLGALGGLVGREAVDAALGRARGEVLDLARRRAGDAARQEKRARVQEDGVRKLGHAVKHAARWARADLGRWEAKAAEVGGALDEALRRGREVLGRCIGAADAAGREAMERIAALAEQDPEESGEGGMEELKRLQVRLEESSKIGVWCRGKLKRLERVAAARSGAPLPEAAHPAPQQDGWAPERTRGVPMPPRQTGPVWIQAGAKGRAGDAAPAGNGAPAPVTPAAQMAPAPVPPAPAPAPQPPPAAAAARTTEDAAVQAQAARMAQATAAAQGNPAAATPAQTAAQQAEFQKQASGTWKLVKNMVTAFGNKAEQALDSVADILLPSAPKSPMLVGTASPLNGTSTSSAMQSAAARTADPQPAAKPPPAPASGPPPANPTLDTTSSSIAIGTALSSLPNLDVTASTAGLASAVSAGDPNRPRLPSKVRKGPLPPADRPLGVFKPPSVGQIDSGLPAPAQPAPAPAPAPPPPDPAPAPAPPPPDAEPRTDLDAADALERKVAALQQMMDSGAGSPSGQSGSPTPARKGTLPRRNGLKNVLDKYGL